MRQQEKNKKRTHVMACKENQFCITDNVRQRLNPISANELKTYFLKINVSVVCKCVFCYISYDCDMMR